MRTVAFVALVLANLALVLVNRSWSVHPIRQITRPNRALLWVVAVAGGLIALALSWPPATALFRFGAFHWHDLAVAAAAALILAVVLDLFKAAWRKRLAG
ncbi:MAG: cation transporting ATPase C-terminal domain-containing protein [Burkholderiaceae bacterium]|nr:cation transporting ATPase C-terminal domain-containing protein [Burkholderiaceae bacterium]